MKKLLSYQYQNIVAESFKHQEIDFYKYYFNIIDEYASSNEDIFDCLISAVEYWREQYMNKVDRSIIWEEDEEGRRIILDPFETYINLTYLGININKEVNKSAFDDQVDLLKGMKVIYDTQELIHETESIIDQIKSKLKNINRNTPDTFEKLFRDKTKAKKVKEIFETKGYTVKGQWQGITSNKGALLAAYHVLKPLLQPGNTTPQVRIFYKEFGLSEDFISDRMKTNYPKNGIVEFENIFSHLLE